MQDQIVLQANRQAERVCKDPGYFFTHHHPVPVVALACATEALVDLQRVDAGFGRANEYCPVDHVLPVPIMLVGDDFTRQELTNRLPVGFVVRPIQVSSHPLNLLDDGDVGLASALTHRLQPVPASGALQFV
jgi:hypothetical protein